MPAREHVFLYVLLLAASAASAGAQAGQATPPKGAEALDLHGKLEVQDGHKVLTVWGTPAERGFAHGYLLGKEIVTLLSEDFGGFMKKAAMQPKDYDRRVVRTLVPSFRIDEDEKAELEGILKGLRARLDPTERRVGFLDREIEYGDLLAINTVGDWLALGCSTVALHGAKVVGGKPAVARNFDFWGFRSLLEEQVIVRSKASESSHAFVAVTHVGSIGAITAMNDEGVFVSIHDVPRVAGMQALLNGNVPRLVALRRLAQRLAAKGAVEKAHEFLDAWPTLYGNNVMVVTPDAESRFAGVLEYDAFEKVDDGATLRVADRHADGVVAHNGENGKNGENGDAQPKELFLTCTNHHRTRALKGKEPSACSRYAKISAWCNAREEPADADALFEVAARAAFSGPDDKLERYRLGTLHQAVGFTGTRTLHLRLGRTGETLGAQKPFVVCVDDLKEAAAK